tara:strand:- start:127 stop:606 length:480 start_codon:yes stop_codon:yes gene_type:complete
MYFVRKIYTDYYSKSKYYTLRSAFLSSTDAVFDLFERQHDHCSLFFFLAHAATAPKTTTKKRGIKRKRKLNFPSPQLWQSPGLLLLPEYEISIIPSPLPLVPSEDTNNLLHLSNFTSTGRIPEGQFASLPLWQKKSMGSLPAELPSSMGTRTTLYPVEG